MEKEWPRCAEIIKLRARYCRYCNFEYSDEEFSAEQIALANALKEIEEKKANEQRALEKMKADEKKDKESQGRRGWPPRL